MTCVICKSCGWVSFAVTRKKAENEVKSFNEYFDTLTKKEQKEYYGGRKSTIDFYEHCFLCNGPYTNFRKAKNSEVPYGSTLQPIIQEKSLTKKKK